MTRARYPTDLTDRKWRRVEPHLPLPKPAGRPRSVDRREIVDAVLYVLRHGITWRALPQRLPALAHRLPLLPPLAAGRGVGAAA